MSNGACDVADVAGKAVEALEAIVEVHQDNGLCKEINSIGESSRRSQTSPPTM